MLLHMDYSDMHPDGYHLRATFADSLPNTAPALSKYQFEDINLAYKCKELADKFNISGEVQEGRDIAAIKDIVTGDRIMVFHKGEWVYECNNVQLGINDKANIDYIVDIIISTLSMGEYVSSIEQLQPSTFNGKQADNYMLCINTAETISLK